MPLQPDNEDELIVCGLSAEVVEKLLRQGALRVEDMICADSRSAAALREAVLRCCLRPCPTRVNLR